MKKIIFYFFIFLALVIPAYAGQGVYAIKRDDGGVSIVNLGDKDIDQTLEEIGLSGRPYKKIKESDLPEKSDRDFWTLEDKEIVIDEDKKQEFNENELKNKDEEKEFLKRLNWTERDVEILKRVISGL